jgi:hypothetical protein
MATITHQASVLPSVPSSGGGTQSNEFEAAIKSVTSSITVGAVFLYDTSADSDGGKWRSKCKGLSWFDEPTLPAGTAANQWNSATRSARSEFPAMALIVADNEDGAETITIYDLDDPAMPMWMVFDAGTHSNDLLRSVGAVSVFALNGRIYCCCDDGFGLAVANMAEDGGSLYTATADSGSYKGNIATRNEATGFNLGAYGVSIAGNTVNDVAATVLEGAEIGALGLPIPTVAVATDSGISVIHGGSGAVYDQTHQVNTNNEAGNVFWDDVGGLYWGSRTNTSNANVYLCYENSTLYATTSSAPLKVFSPTNSTQGLINYISAFNAASKLSDGFAVGSVEGLSLFKTNKGNPDESAVAYITSTYNTGYMVGDIRGAWLANTGTDATFEDRCVKGNDMTEQGTVTDGDVATDAELKYYTNWNSSNYLSLAYTSDLDFTNTMSVMFWVKDYGNSTDIYGIGTRSSTLSQSIYIDGGYDYRWTLSSDGSAEQQFEIPESNTLSDWTFICFTLNAGAVRGYKNGVNIADSNGTFTGNIFSQATDTEGLEIGKGPIANGGSSGGKLSLFRISATAPTPKQIADIYAAEKPLFAAGAACLLQSNDGSYSNQIRDLAFDKSSGILSATQYSNTTAAVTKFRGLEAIDTFNGKNHGWTDEHTRYAASAGGVSAFTSNSTGGGVLVDLPALDVRAELNEGESKLPDDGKLHFEGVTTDATQTVIASIPMDELESYTVDAVVTGHSYQSASSNRVFTHIRETFNRNLGGNVQEPGDHYKLENLGTASCDVSIRGNGTNETIEIKVTGVSGQSPATLDRMVWTAEVEVQRISEKTYER